MSGSRRIFLFIALPLVLIFVGISLYTMSLREDPSIDNKNIPSECTPLVLQSPVDVSKATAILYPGQERGGHYKAHGGFRFDGLKNEDVSVMAPFAASVFAGSRYIEQGEVQYMFDFMTSCGLTYRFDHLKTLSAKFQAIAETLPEPKVDDSRTSDIRVGTDGDVVAGEVIATAVGFETGPNGPNVSVDFGVYDKRARNDASKDEAWAKLHEAEKELAWYGVCWFDLLPAADAAIVRSLPAGDSAAGKTSDYCK